MAAASKHQELGLRQVAPKGGTVENTSIDIIAIHGLGTQSPRTWEFKRKDDGRIINWLSDDDMLSAAIPEASIFTYDWNANYFENAPVQTLLGHADNLLSHIAQREDSAFRPIIFVASCFGGLILAEAMNRAAQEGSIYRPVLINTTGVVFLATPFRGSDAAKQAQWQVVVGGIMGNQTSRQLVDDLKSKDKELRKLTQLFAELIHKNSIRLPVFCFYEAEKTNMLRKFLSSSTANRVSGLVKQKSKKMLVTEQSACLDGLARERLEANHTCMNKFDGPKSSNYNLVKGAIRELADGSPAILMRRKAQAIRERHFIVPFGRNGDFVGRELILQQLLRKVPPNSNKDDCQRNAINGLGGIGKTQIALAIAYHVRDQYPDCSIFWVPVIDATSFENAYRQIGKALNIPGLRNESADVKTLVRTAMSNESIGDWLLIVDNSDDMKLLFADTALSAYLPFSRKGSILFTTRVWQVALKLNIPPKDIVTVSEMNDDEAMKMLRNNVKETQILDMESTTLLLECLSKLPLAIKQASAYMARTDISASKYLQHYQSSDRTRVNLLSTNFGDSNRYHNGSNPVATTWLISFNQISRDYPLAARYLKLICYLAEKDIPVSLLEREDEADSLLFDEAIGILKGYAFIIQHDKPDTFDIHRLVRLAMRNWLHGDETWQYWAEIVIKHVTNMYPFPTFQNRDTWLRYLPHGEAVLKLQEELDVEDCIMSLLHKVASTYFRLQNYEKAENGFRQAAIIKGRVLGEENHATLLSLSNLALVIHSQKRYDEAENIQRRVLGLMELELGKEHHDIIATLANMAVVLKSQNRYAEAELIERQALASFERSVGTEHSSTVSCLGQLVETLLHQKKYNEAMDLCEQLLSFTEQESGKENTDALCCLHNIAYAFMKQQMYEQAEQVQRQARRSWEQTRGKYHFYTLECVSNLAIILSFRNKCEEAEHLCRQVLCFREQKLGKEHHSTLSSLHSLAMILRGQKKYEEAEQVQRHAFALREQTLGMDHPDTLTNSHTLATILSSQRKYEEAEHLFRQTLHLRERVLGKDHPHTLDTETWLEQCIEGKSGLTTEECTSGC